MDLAANSGIRGLSESAVLALTVECVLAGSYGVEEPTLDSGMREALRAMRLNAADVSWGRGGRRSPAGPGADTGVWLRPSDKISEAVADASSAAAKNRRRRAPSAEAGGCAGLGCSMAWAAADRPRALP